MGAVTTRLGRVGVASEGTERAATPILFLHGVGSDKSVWRLQLRHFGVSRPAHAFDYPGYGDSEPLDGGSRDVFAAAILAAMDSLAVERAHICGLSLGGVIAIAMSALAPKRCVSLILADSFAVHPDGPAIFDRSIEASRTVGMRALAESRADALLAQGATSSVRAEVVAAMSRIDPAAYAQGAAAVWLADQRERAAAIRVPTLVMVGAEDRITPPALSHELAALVPGARVETIAAAGHLANLEQPDGFNRAVGQFLSEIEEKP
jgi:3-oxoadipate enol-lactonase